MPGQRGSRRLSLDEGLGDRGVEAESQPGDRKRSHPRRWRGGFQKNGTMVSYMGTEDRPLEAGEGALGHSGRGSRCVHGGQEQQRCLVGEHGAAAALGC